MQNDSVKSNKLFVLPPPMSPYIGWFYGVIPLLKLYVIFGFLPLAALLIEGIISKKFRKAWWAIFLILYAGSFLALKYFDYIQYSSICRPVPGKVCPVY